MRWRVNPTVQKAIRVAMHELSESCPQTSVTKKHILKVLYLAKERLPDDNQFKRDLAFYWYKEGPHSEVMYDNLCDMVDNGLVRAHKTAMSERYSLVSEQTLLPVEVDADLKAVEREIKLMANENPTVQTAVKRAYETAPYKWYTTYNREFRPKLKSHFRRILGGGKSRYSAQNVLRRLDNAVLDYPTNREFREHRMVFMDFAKMMNALLRSDSYSTQEYMIETLYKLCDEIWAVFAYGARIHNHDPYYDNSVDAWENRYKDELDELDREVRERLEEFDKIVVDDIGIDPDVVDMIQHPEKQEFVPWESNITVGNG